MTIVNEPTARAILDAAHAAWNRRDLEDMLTWYCDDLTYFCNMGASDGGPLRVHGKAEMRAFLEPVLSVADCTSVPMSFNYRDGIGRAQVEVVIRHRKSGQQLQGTYRQILFFEDSKILALEEFHDAARMQAFWRLVQGLEEIVADPGKKKRATIQQLLADAHKPQPPFAK